MAEPWKISSIAEALPEFDHDTIRSMLTKCRWDIDAAFSRLLDEGSPTLPSEDNPSSAMNGAPPSSTSGTGDPENAGSGSGSSQEPSSGPLPLGSSSRSSSRHSTASKRSVDESDDDSEPIRSPVRRRRDRDRKRRILQNVTVGISVRDKVENDVIAIQLRVDPNTVAEQANGNGGATEESPGGVSATSAPPRSDAEDAEGRARDNSGRSPLSFGQSSEAMSDEGDGSEYEDHAMASDSEND